MSALAGKTHREVVLGVRGAVHIAHPLADLTLCGKPIGSRPAVDAFDRTSVDGFRSWDDRPFRATDACHECQTQTFSGGGESRAMGAYA